jgi:hypothetical protein
MVDARDFAASKLGGLEGPLGEDAADVDIDHGAAVLGEGGSGWLLQWGGFGHEW